MAKPVDSFCIALVDQWKLVLSYADMGWFKMIWKWYSRADSALHTNDIIVMEGIRLRKAFNVVKNHCAANNYEWESYCLFNPSTNAEIQINKYPNITTAASKYYREILKVSSMSNMKLGNIMPDLPDQMINKLLNEPCDKVAVGVASMSVEIEAELAAQGIKRSNTAAMDPTAALINLINQAAIVNQANAQTQNP